MSGSDMQQQNSMMQECARNCLNTYASCTMTAAHCLEMGGEHAGREHQTAMLDCARLCATAADVLLRGSPIHGAVCNVCAMACRICEKYCRSLGAGDAVMAECADRCARSAESCEDMAGHLR